jgi:hypothetical protein
LEPVEPTLEELGIDKKLSSRSRHKDRVERAVVRAALRRRAAGADIT